MIRGTTPTFHLTITDDSVDLTQALNVYATFKQMGVQLDKSGEDIDVSAHQVDVYLTQEESLMFAEGSNIEVQLNWTYGDGSRAATKIKSVNVGRNLIGSVLE